MTFLYKVLSVSEEVSLSPADQPVDPMLWSLLMVGAFAAVLVVMVALGYVGENEGNQLWEVAVRMRYLVAATYLFSAVLQFVGLALIYNLDKKTLAKMNADLGRDVEAAEAVETTETTEA